MASIITGTIALGSLIGGAVLTGAGFSAGALGFQRAEQAIEKKFREPHKPKEELKESNIGTKRYIRDNNAPFSRNRFLNNIDRRAFRKALQDIDIK